MEQVTKELVDAYVKAGKYVEDVEGVEVVTEGDWVQDGKYQFSDTIVRYKGQLFEINKSRSGSPFTDWWYSPTGITPVEEKEEVIVKKSYVPAGPTIEVDEE